MAAEGHLAWFVLDAVGALDLVAFYAGYREDGRSRPAYEPSMMVALLLYSYCCGTRSARAIERACEVDIANRVIAAHTTRWPPRGRDGAPGRPGI